MDKKKKLFILIICILPLMLVTLGFSTWIVIHEISIAPKFDPDSVFYNELNGQTVVYNGTAQLPSSEKIDVKSTFIKTKYRKVGQETSEYKDGIPTNAGEYYIYFNDTRDDATSLGASDVLFTIKKANVKEIEDVTVNYNQGTNNGYFTTDMTTSSIIYSGSFSHKDNTALTVDGTISYSDTRTKLEIGSSNYSYTFTPAPITDEWGDSVTNYEIYKDDTALIKTRATITFMNGSSQYGSIQHIELNGKIANPGNLSKTGYTFDGWEYNDSIWNFDTCVTTDMKLYSSFSIINYTLTYLDNDGSTLTTSNPKTYTIETATFTLANPTKNGYVFEGWTESNSSNILSTVTVSKGSTGNKTFTANWWKPITINMPSDITKDYDKSAVVLSDPLLTINYETVSSLPTGATISYTYSSGSSEMVNYGEYTVTATLTLTEELINQGYKLDTTYSDLVTIVKINKKTVQVDYTWNYSSAFTYDTQTKTVNLKNEPTGLTPIYSNNSYTNAGNYIASVSFAEENNDNYVITGTASTLEWEIKKAQIDCSGVKLSVTSFTYDEQTKTVSVQGIPSNVNSNITGTLSAVNAGNYTVTPGLTVSNSNYELVNAPTELSWVINKASIDGSSISWIYSETYPFTYDGNEKSVSLENVPNGVTVTYDEGSKGTNAGTYTATATLSCDSNHTVTGAPNSLTWKIDPMKISVDDEILSKSYTANISYTDTINYLNTQIGFHKYNTTTPVSLTTQDYLIYGIHNGAYYYGYDESNEELLNVTITVPTGLIDNNEKYLYGSTYTCNVALAKDSNYELVDSVFIFKYKTAFIGYSTPSEYLTVEEAFKSDGTINFAGNSTGANTYVVTSFSYLSTEQENPYNSEYYATDSSGNRTFSLNNRELIIPYTDYSSTDESMYIKNEALSGYTGNVYAALIVNEKIIINTSGESTVAVTSLVGYSQGVRTTASMNRGVLINNGTINMNSGSTLYSYGYIKGTGLIELSSATAYESFTIYDWPGGSAATSLVLGQLTSTNKAIPMCTWSIHNNACKTKINSTSTYNGYAYFVMSGSGQPATFEILGSSSNCLFKAQDTNGYIIKEAIDARIWGANDANTGQLLGENITGLNQIYGQKDVLSLYGNYIDGNFSISLGEMSLETSTSMAAPISYLDVNIMTGKFTIDKSDYIFLPGTKVTIENGANVEITATSSGFIRKSYIDVMFLKYSTATSNGVFPKCVDTTDAQLIVKGSLTIKGYLGGTVINSGGTITNTKGGSSATCAIFKSGSSSATITESLTTTNV